MPLNPARLLALKIPAVEHSFGAKDCILYALGLGFGQDPLDRDELHSSTRKISRHCRLTR